MSLPAIINLHPQHALTQFIACFAQAPRGIRIFDRELQVLWDNQTMRESTYPVFRNSRGQIISVPDYRPDYDEWPVARVRAGASHAEKAYRVHSDGGVLRAFRVQAWPVLDSSGTIDLIIEESEKVEIHNASLERVSHLNHEVEGLLHEVVKFLQQGPNGHSLRLTNPYLMPCQDVRSCARPACPAFETQDRKRCWETPNTLCPDAPDQSNLLTKFDHCSKCEVFDAACPDPLIRLAENFNRLVSLIQHKYQEALETQRHLQQADKLAVMGELLAGIAHEIKNPLGIIMGRLDLLGLEHDSITGTQLEEDLDTVAEQANRIKNIIDHMLKMARPDPPEARHVNLNDVITETAGMVRKTLKDGNVQIVADLHPGIPPIHADLIQVQQVLLNIILNARDAMPEGGTLRIVTSEDTATQELHVALADTGIGMTEEETRKLFHSFHSTKLNKGGTGLGLAVCQRIMRTHGGRISAESVPGAGTTMHLWFPTVGAKL